MFACNQLKVYPTHVGTWEFECHVCSSPVKTSIPVVQQLRAPCQFINLQTHMRSKKCQTGAASRLRTSSFSSSPSASNFRGGFGRHSPPSESHSTTSSPHFSPTISQPGSANYSPAPSFISPTPSHLSTPSHFSRGTSLPPWSPNGDETPLVWDSPGSRFANSGDDA
jgi:hypothetical protein